MVRARKGTLGKEVHINVDCERGRRDQERASETVLGGLAQIPQISVFGMTENQIVTVIEGDDPVDVNGS